MFKVGGSCLKAARFLMCHNKALDRASPVSLTSYVKFRREVHTANVAFDELKDIHSKRIVKNLLMNDSLYELQYLMNTMVYSREHECLRELRIITQEHTLGYMASTPDEALLLSMLLKLMGAKNTIEVGVFTGFNVLATALALPDDGKVLAVDVCRDYFDLGLPVIEKAGVAHKPGNEGRFDFAFVDADKLSYGIYHEQLLRLVRLGGVLAYDNTLYHGAVATPPHQTPSLPKEGDHKIWDFMRSFNAKIAADSRIEAVQLPVADGITLCRRLV